MKLRVLLLYPLTILYTGVTTFRNYLFTNKYIPSFNFEIMTINVGNLSVGGTGKTPMVEYLIQLLKERYALATLSRGYKRKSKGFLLANKWSTVNDLGDEPFQIYLKYGKKIKVAVGEDRSLAIPKILMKKPETQLIILDDAYQHRSVITDFNILLTQYSNPFYNDFVLPSGSLREERLSAKRANAIIITKCPQKLSPLQKEHIIKKVKKYSAKDTPVYFSSIHYEAPVSFIKWSKFSKKVILFTGLADSTSLVEYASASFEVVKVVSFKDHYDYKMEDIRSLIKMAKENNAQLLTSAKDMVKINAYQSFEELKEVNFFYLPISVQFLFDKAGEFDALIEKAILTKYEK